MPSTAIRMHRYDRTNRILTIVFISGERYRYFDVPEDIGSGMDTAFSKGAYFNKYIKDRYRFAHDQARP